MTDHPGPSLSEDARRHFRLTGHPFACVAGADPSGLPPGTEAAGQLAALLERAGETRPVHRLVHPEVRARALFADRLARGLAARGHTTLTLRRPADDGASLTRLLLERVGLGGVEGDQVDLGNILRVFLVNERVQGRTPVVIAHDVDHWPASWREQLVSLAALRHQHLPAVRLVLLGVPASGPQYTESALAKLGPRLRRPEEIVTVRPTEFAAWLQRRCLDAGGRRLFTAGAMAALHRVSGGNVTVAGGLA